MQSSGQHCDGEDNQLQGDEIPSRYSAFDYSDAECIVDRSGYHPTPKLWLENERRENGRD